MFELQVWLIELTIGFVASFYSMGLTHAAALCTIGWIFYQFIERRRLNQANIDEFFRKQSRTSSRRSRNNVVRSSTAFRVIEHPLPSRRSLP